MGDRPSRGDGALHTLMADWMRRGLFLFALERGFLDSVVDRVVVEPFVRLARRLTRLDAWLCGAVLSVQTAIVELAEDRDE